MAALYTEQARYRCTAETSAYAGPLCQSLAARCVDDALEALLLRALEPAALDLSLAVAANLDAERARLEQLWFQRLERAQYDVDRSRRQYNAVEPENRLVARTLERQLEEHLVAQLKLQEDHRRDRAARPATLTNEEREGIRRLASDIPLLWRASSTTMPQKKTIVRQLVEEVRVTVHGDSERVTMAVTWVGGHRTDTPVVRPIAKLSQLSYYADLVSRANALAREGSTQATIAEQLNAEGWRPAKRRETFVASTVSSLLGSDALATMSRESPPDIRAQRGDNEWTMSALARSLDMPSITLRTWVRRGWAKGRKAPSVNPAGRWLVWADTEELARLRALRMAPPTRGAGSANTPSAT